jgi:uncharacterized protein YkwD
VSRASGSLLPIPLPRPRGRRRAAIGVVAAALSLAVPAASLAGSAPLRHRRASLDCRNADTPASAASKQAMRAAVLCLINQQRTARHLPPLSDSPRLDRSAQLWTNRMVATSDFTHGSDFAARLTAAGFNWSYAGENIASGFRTPRQVVTGWMASTGHCRNILGPDYANVGTGVDAAGIGNLTGSATWTQDFGLWSGHAPPSSNQGAAQGCPYR